MYIFLRSNGASPDPRLQKYIDYIKGKNITYRVLAWDRLNEGLDEENYIYFKKETPFGGGVKNIPAKISWSLFLIKELIKNRHLYNVIHACDIDTAAPSFFIKKVLKKKLVFDVFDWVSDSSVKNIVLKIVNTVENFVFKNADKVILCEEYRIQQVKERSRRPSLVLPNIPNINMTTDFDIKSTLAKYKKDYKFNLSYVGVFDNHRGLEEILETVSKNSELCLHIAGFGLNTKLVEDYAQKYENIVYWGKVSYNKGLNIMKECDFILALYFLSNPVHRYAAPNKYYESLFLSKPIISNLGTAFAEKILFEKTGVLIDENNFNLDFLYDLSNDEIKLLEINAQKVWEEKYQQYTKNFMIEYFEID